MKLESIIKRKKGTIVEMDAPQRVYHFLPESGAHADPHVCEVDVEAHARALLRIREGFRLAEGELPAQVDEEREKDEEALAGSTVHSASYTIKGGDKIELDDLVAMAWEDSGLSVEDWNKLLDQDRYGYIDATLKELQDGNHEDTPIPEEPAPQPVAIQQVAEQPNPAADPVESRIEDAAGGPVPETSGEGTKDGYEDMTRAQLAEEFKKLIGRDPARQMNKADIIAAIKSAKADEDD